MGADQGCIETVEREAVVRVDREQRTLTVRGHWWYEGVTSVRDHPRGSEVTYQVRNVAPWTTRWLAELQHIGFASSMRGELTARLERAGGGAPLEIVTARSASAKP